MDTPKNASRTVRELLVMIVRDMGRSESELSLPPANPYNKVFFGGRRMGYDAFLLLPVRSYRRSNLPGQWEIEINKEDGPKTVVPLNISFAEFKVGRSVGEMTAALRPRFATRVKARVGKQPVHSSGLEEAMV